jgi:hypothetical protein
MFHKKAKFLPDTVAASRAIATKDKQRTMVEREASLTDAAYCLAVLLCASDIAIRFVELRRTGAKTAALNERLNSIFDLFVCSIRHSRDRAKDQSQKDV